MIMKSFSNSIGKVRASLGHKAERWRTSDKLCRIYGRGVIAQYLYSVRDRKHRVKDKRYGVQAFSRLLSNSGFKEGSLYLDSGVLRRPVYVINCVQKPEFGAFRPTVTFRAVYSRIALLDLSSKTTAIH